MLQMVGVAALESGKNQEGLSTTSAWSKTCRVSRKTPRFALVVAFVAQLLLVLGPAVVLCQESTGRTQLELSAVGCCERLGPVNSESQSGLSPTNDCNNCTDVLVTVLQDREQVTTIQATPAYCRLGQVISSAAARGYLSPRPAINISPAALGLRTIVIRC